MRAVRLLLGLAVITSFISCVAAADFSYLDEFCDPYYVHGGFPKLTTPQWVGEEGVEAVVILSIDDMRGYEKWETFLRPIINRMKQSRGRAPISIMTCRIDPREPHLQTWLKEGLSIEVHTIDHPCPCLQEGDFDRAARTYHDCVDMMTAIPGSRPVAFRMPCCDSQNTPSPRFWTEIFNRTSAQGNFLRIDSSVFNIVTPADKSLPRDLVLDKAGKPRFRRYLPFPSFVNTIEDYPYPYVIGRLCWEFPCVVPSDWEAQNVQRPNNPQTVADMQRALDAVVRKQGVYPLVFHPHGWIRNDQIVELIDYAEKKYGPRVKFLNFRDCAERIAQHLLAGETLRAADGGDNGVRLLDLNADGFLDVVIANEGKQLTRRWLPQANRWEETGFPLPIVRRKDGKVFDAGVRFGVVQADGFASCLVRNEMAAGGWSYDGNKWQADDDLLKGLAIDGREILTSKNGIDQGVRLRDLDGDGKSELVAGGPEQTAVFRWDPQARSWRRLPFALPEGTSVVDAHGDDAGFRFVDVNGDARDDIVFSNQDRWSAHLFTSLEAGWSKSIAAQRGDDDAVPPIVRGAANNGAWFHSDRLWVQNEDSQRLPDGVARLSFKALLVKFDDAAASDEEIPPPKSPQEALQSFHVRPGLKIELVAAEPLVVDPVAFDWGPDGRLWVVEMHDYPSGIDGRGQPGGRVKVLSDTDDDGRYDKATVFLDNLPFPTGVKVWRGGILVSAAPRIIYAEDTDNDGAADKTQTLYEGFGEGNQQHRVNGLRWGLDNWLYVGNGDSGGKIRSTKTGEAVDVRSRDLRIHPDNGQLQAISGSTQYGINRDDWGDWFGGNNSHPAWHYVLDDVYLRRNPHFAPPSVKREISVAPGAARVYPVSRTLARFNDFHTANHFTSACSPMIYRDRALGEEYYGNVFVCEPVHNLVHREIVSPAGATFTSRRADDEQQGEFLASNDNWFRPAMIRTGPDGALWIADMYRFVIEHPKWIPEEWQKKLDLRAGDDRGRIYRIVRSDDATQPRGPRLERLKTDELVARLESTNGTVRDLVQQMLIWRDDAAAAESLEKLVSQSASPTARLHALGTLDGMNALKVETVRAALGDKHPGVRRHAVRLSDRFTADSPELIDDLAALAADDDLHVRMQLAYSAGGWPDAEAAARVLVKLLIGATDEYVPAAAMSSLNRRNVPHVLAEATARGDEKAGQQTLAALLSQAIAFGAADAIAPAVKRLAAPGADGGFSSGQLQSASLLLQQLAGNARLNEDAAAAKGQLAPMFAFARRTSARAESEDAARVASIGLLQFAPQQAQLSADSLRALLQPANSPGVQSAALAALMARGDADLTSDILQRWRSLSPALRSQLLDALLAREADTRLLLAALEQQTVPPAQLDARRRQSLLEHPQEALRARAKQLFGAAAPTPRAKVVEQLAGVLQKQGDVAAGRTVFAKRCAVCHRLEGAGTVLGPDLAALTDRSPKALLTAILDPNRAVEDKFVSYTATTRDGKIHSGLISEEAGASVTLAAADGKTLRLLRKDIDELTSSGKSFMPEGLEQDVSPQQLADVIAYVRGVVPPKQFAGNVPRTITADDKGILRLPAAAARIFGSRIVFEPQYKNLGWWQSEDDYAVWTIDVPKDGRFQVEFDYACHEQAAGDRFIFQVGSTELTGTVDSTGTWDDYRSMKVGQIELSAGQHEVIVRPGGKIHSALIDLRTVRLSP